MRKVMVLGILMTAVAVFATAPAMAKGWFVGGGIESVSFGEDLKDVDTGGGITFSFGYRFSPLFSLDFLWGGTIHDENLAGGEAAQGNFLAGAKFSFNHPNTFQPYLTAGLSSHAVDFDYFEEIDGGGIFAGFGADIFFAENQAINIGIRSSSWNGEDSGFDYDVTTGIFSVVYNYHFLQ